MVAKRLIWVRSTPGTREAHRRLNARNINLIARERSVRILGGVGGLTDWQTVVWTIRWVSAIASRRVDILTVIGWMRWCGTAIICCGIAVLAVEALTGLLVAVQRRHTCGPVLMMDVDDCNESRVDGKVSALNGDDGDDSLEMVRVGVAGGNPGFDVIEAI